MRIIRVFPRRTKATPDDELAVCRYPELFDEADEVHISVTFSWDMPKAESLAKSWSAVAPVKMGGPAIGDAGHDFTPGLYLKQGYVITSRGCPNKCWFCDVWKREGNIRELPVTEGWIVQDDNILACSDKHFVEVCEMLKRQKEQPTFSGGLEAARLTPWHVERLARIKPKQLFFAYDTPDDYEPLVQAGRLLIDAGLSMNALRCYVLCGYPKDTFEDAEKRMEQTILAGFMPAAMLYRNKAGFTEREWRKFARFWMRPAIFRRKINELRAR